MKSCKCIPSRILVIVGAWVLVGLTGLLDYLSGRDLVVSAFYLFPISWVTWKVGRESGLALALFSTVCWLAGDYLSGYGYSHPAIPLWNGLMLLAMFLPATYLLSAFQRAHVHLEETVAVRTVALQREIEERKRAEIAKIHAERLAVVGTMAAQVAHEVRNPLGAIMLTLDLVEDDLVKISAETGRPLDESTGLVGELRTEVQRIDQVILDYLVLARPRIPRIESLDLNDFIDRKLAFVRSVFTESGVTLATGFSRQPLTVRADGDQLWQAILNLVRNGLDAMHDGGTLTVETACEQDSAIIRVTDTGCGMTPAQQERIFVPFATSKPHGIGLGLALVNQIIAEHKGRIECRTAPDKGTTFTIILPLEPAPPAEEEPANHRAVTSKKPTL